MLEKRGELPPNLFVQERLPGVGTVVADPRSEGLTLASNKLREIDRVAALQLANWAIGRLGELRVAMSMADVRAVPLTDRQRGGVKQQAVRGELVEPR